MTHQNIWQVFTAFMTDYATMATTMTNGKASHNQGLCYSWCVFLLQDLSHFSGVVGGNPFFCGCPTVFTDPPAHTLTQTQTNKVRKCGGKGLTRMGRVLSPPTQGGETTGLHTVVLFTGTTQNNRFAFPPCPTHTTIRLPEIPFSHGETDRHPVGGGATDVVNAAQLPQLVLPAEQHLAQGAHLKQNAAGGPHVDRGPWLSRIPGLQTSEKKG